MDQTELNTYLVLDNTLRAVLSKAEPAAPSLNSIHNMIKSSSVTRKVIALGSSGKKGIIIPAH